MVLETTIKYNIQPFFFFNSRQELFAFFSIYNIPSNNKFIAHNNIEKYIGRKIQKTNFQNLVLTSFNLYKQVNLNTCQTFKIQL